MCRKLLVTLFLLMSSSLLFGEEQGEVKIRYALKLEMVKERGSILDKFKLIKELGYDGVELSAPRYNKEEVLEASKATGLPVHGVVCSTHWKKQLSDSSSEVRAEGLAGLKAAIEEAAYYGANSVLLVPGRVRSGTTYEECWERSISEIRKVLPLAEERGVTIALENVWNDFLKTPEETLRYISELNSPMLGVYFDIGNTVRYNEPASWIPLIKDQFIKLDVKGYKKQPAGKNPAKGFQVKIGEDDNNWPAVCAELKKISYQGWATAEVRGGDRQRLKEILANMKAALSH
jgi:hexulose-6-phosphate isomerase